MSVPDWPTTYGQNMFLFPLQDWVGGIQYEHFHRLVGYGVSSLIVVLAAGLYFQERVWLRWMGVVAPLFFAGEATLGGLRVVLSEDQLGILHGALAQLLFVSVSLIGLFTSRWWMEGRRDATAPKWTGRTLAICGLIFCQLLLGATMRHQHAGLSISDFPLAYGQAWPKTDPASVAEYNRARLSQVDPSTGLSVPPTSALFINMQMAHRVGAVLITVAILAAAAAMWLAPGTAPILRRWSAAWVGLVLVQFLLGACTIWTNKAADVATAHVAVGALTLVLGTLLTAMSWRLQSGAELAKRGVA